MDLKKVVQRDLEKAVTLANLKVVLRAKKMVEAMDWRMVDQKVAQKVDW